MKTSPRIHSGPAGLGRSKPMKPLMHCFWPPASICNALDRALSHSASSLKKEDPKAGFSQCECADQAKWQIACWLCWESAVEIRS